MASFCLSHCRVSSPPRQWALARGKAPWDFNCLRLPRSQLHYINGFDPLLRHISDLLQVFFFFFLLFIQWAGRERRRHTRPRECERVRVRGGQVGAMTRPAGPFESNPEDSQIKNEEVGRETSVKHKSTKRYLKTLLVFTLAPRCSLPTETPLINHQSTSCLI